MKQKFFVLFFIFLCFFCYGMSEEELYLSAMDAYNTKNFDKAKSIFEDFNSKYGNSKYKPNVLLKLAELQTDFTASEKLFNQVIKDYSGTEYEAEGTFELGRLYFSRGDYQECMERMNKIISKFSNTVWIEPAYYYCLLSLNAQGKFQDVEKIYREYSEKRFYLYKNRIKNVYADMKFKNGLCEECVNIYKEILDEKENEKYIYLPQIYQRLIICYDKLGDVNEKSKYEYDLKQFYPNSLEAKNTNTTETEEVRIMEEKKESPAYKNSVNTKESSKKVFYTIQIGAFSNEKFAQLTVDKLRDKNYDVFTKQDGNFIKISVGRFNTKEAAEKFAEDFSKKEKITNYLIKQAWE
ncbi:MAG TPA: SPOR domain-containing protein [Candidatus Goldiibacteriota bacterium]|nr:SPOR domain-containing protein [Candidatus Goldiibacteriota bacterium]